MDSLPITIKRSFVGYVIRLLYAGVAFALLVFTLYFIRLEEGSVSPELIPLAAIYLIAVAVLLLVSLYLYSLSSVRLTATGITVEYWRTLFADSEAEMSWYRVQSAESKQAGVVGELFGYGTLIIQQAGTQQPIYLTYVQRADYWATYIQQRADASPQPVHEVGNAH